MVATAMEVMAMGMATVTDTAMATVMAMGMGMVTDTAMVAMATVTMKRMERRKNAIQSVIIAIMDQAKTIDGYELPIVGLL